MAMPRLPNVEPPPDRSKSGWWKIQYWRRWKKHNEESKKWKASHPEKAAEILRKYRTNHRNACRQRCRDWYERNKGTSDYIARKLANSAKRRALKAAAAVNLKGIKNWMRLVRREPIAFCEYCGRSVEGKSVHFDHIVPLSKGGHHSLENLCISCPSCNLRKGAKSAESLL